VDSSGVEPWLIEAARQRVAEFSTQLRSAGDTGVPVPNLEWTAADLAQHVASLPSYWDGLHEHGADFERPADFAFFADNSRAHIKETDGPALATLIDSEFDGYITRLANDPPRWLYGLEATASDMLGMVLNETIIHGIDLAGVTGATPPEFERREANAVIGGFMVTTPFFIDANKAQARPDGVYYVSFKEGKEFTWTKSGGALTIVEGRPAKADATMKADPAMFLLSSLGRVGQVRAALSGKMVVTGRKPWRFLGLAKMAIDGV